MVTSSETCQLIGLLCVNSQYILWRSLIHWTNCFFTEIWNQIPPRSYSKSLITHFGLQESCPDGTVLIRRTLKEDLLRARAFRGPLKPQKDQSFTPMSYTSTIPGQHVSWHFKIRIFSQILWFSTSEYFFLVIHQIITKCIHFAFNLGQHSSYFMDIKWSFTTFKSKNWC